MKNRILSYREKIDRLLEKEAPETDWPEVKQEHLTQLSFFQHERLVHLLVTMLFALLEMLCILPAFLTGSPALILLSAVLLILLLPYILHYYLLENEVQKIYRQYDRICTLEKDADSLLYLFLLVHPPRSTHAEAESPWPEKHLIQPQYLYGRYIRFCGIT